MIRIITVCLNLIFVLSACSGGGGDNPTYSISGDIFIESNIATDSDNNDPFSRFSDNSIPSNAQNINNVVIVNGYVTESATLNEGDRFELTSDPFDYYRVTLQAGQVIRLNIINHSNSNNLDLGLYNSSDSLIAESISPTRFEEIEVPSSGDYFIRVEATAGASKYVLQLVGTISSTNAINNRNIHLADMIPGEVIVKYKPSALQTFSDSRTISGAEFPTTSRPILEKMTEPSSENRMAAIAKDSGTDFYDKNIQASNPENYLKLQTLNKIKALINSGQVEYASPNFMRRVQLVPNDEFYPQQWHYPLMNLPQAWEVTTGFPDTGDVIVAVVDTGIFSEHEDLVNKLVDGYDFISNVDNAGDGNGIDPDPEDEGDSADLGESSWHGTHVAGTIAAESNNNSGENNNNSGVAGVSWGAKIMPLRACGRLGCSTFDVIQSVLYAAGLENNSNTVPSQPADIINLSLGGGGASSAEAAVFQEVFDRGIIVVAAAGNEATSQLSYPASYSGVFSVSALDSQSELSYYSNFGLAIDIAAPGGDLRADLTRDGNSDGVMSTVVDDSSGTKQSAYEFYQGTSMASPHVAGMFALMKAVYPSLTAQQVKFYLEQGDLTQDIGDPGRDNLYGYGLADAFEAVKLANTLAGGDLTEIVSVFPSTINLGSLSTATITLESIGGGNPQVDNIVQSPWISAVNPITVDAQGMGEYEVIINRDGLGDGFYTGNITFNFNTASSVSVPVNITVGNLTTEGETAALYGILYNINTNSTEYGLNLSASNGVLKYDASDIAAGNYIVLISTDVENDFLLCQSGEVCGIYPATSRAEIVSISSDREDLDVTVGIITGSGTSSIASTDPISSNPTFRRAQHLNQLDGERLKGFKPND